MPLYEYECKDCGERSEVIQSFSDRPLRKCPLCGGRVKKLVSAPAFQFKGTGWYVTDYADKGKKKAAASESESGKSSDSEKGDSKKKSGESKSKSKKKASSKSKE